MSSAPSPAFDPDAAGPLPWRNRMSLIVLYGLCALNAFNDNILKMLLVGLAPKVVEGTFGQDIGLWLGGIILIPYVLFAPLAGFLSDRFSKRSVIIAMLVMQSLVLLMAGLVFKLALGKASVLLALGMFFLLALQSTLFSPAKMGILKELGGSRRIGMLSGWLQMVTMIGILGGLSLGGPWFDWLFRGGLSAWEAASGAVWVLLAVSVVALVLGWLLQKTAAQSDRKFHAGVLCEHFTNVRETLKRKDLRAACAGVALYWFVGSMVAAMFVDAGLLLHPDKTEAGAASAASLMTLMVGLGTAAGSLVVAGLCRRRVELGMVPLGALGMALALAGAGLWTPSGGAYEVSLVMLGLCSAAYMVPIQAFIQDQAEPSKRGRVLSSMNLVNSLAGVAAMGVLFAVKGGLGLGVRAQFWLLAVLMLLAVYFLVKTLPQELIRFVGRKLVRWLYGLRVVNKIRMPESGGVLMLPNHVSYLDGLLLSSAFDRPVRFVIWEPLYRTPYVHGFVKLFGTVPISPVRAKDAVRNVVQALRSGELVCLFAEGQLTRHGMLNELRRGFEVMARQADVPVVPMYQDGMWGSIFTFECGHFFSKLPNRMVHPVSLWVGEARPPKESSREWLQEELLRLGNEAFLARKAFAKSAEKKWPALANGMRLADAEWHGLDEVLWLCGAGAPLVAESLRVYARLRRGVILHIGDEAMSTGGKKVVAIGTDRELSRAMGADAAWGGRPVSRVVRLLPGVPGKGGLENAGLNVPVFSAMILEENGAWLSLAVPEPSMPPGHEGEQAGNRDGSLGRLLPGWAYEMSETGAVLRGWHPGADEKWTLAGVVLDSAGHLMPQSEA